MARDPALERWEAIGDAEQGAARHPCRQAVVGIELDQRVGAEEYRQRRAAMNTLVAPQARLGADIGAGPSCAGNLPDQRLDAVEAEQVRCLLEVVDDIVDLGRELVDVLAVEWRQVLRVEELDQVARDLIARGFGRFDLILRHAGVGMLVEPPLDESRDVEGVSPGPGEEDVELGGAGCELDLHVAGRTLIDRGLLSIPRGATLRPCGRLSSAR